MVHTIFVLGMAAILTLRYREAPVESRGCPTTGASLSLDEPSL
jgi:hypothetical protein